MNKEGEKRRHLSVKAKITLWYAAVLLLICLLAMVIFAVVSERAAEAHYVKTLESAAVIMMDEMEIEHGMLEIDDDLEDVPNVYASLFDLDGQLVYGRSRVGLPFAEGAVRRADQGEHRWYIHDTLIEVPGMEPVWMRLYMSADVAANMYHSMMRTGIWVLPFMAAAALFLGYRMTVRAFRPVARINALAASIAGGKDLSARIALPQPGGRDELHDMADTINSMLSRLEQAFEHERRFAADAAHELRTPLNAMRQQGEYALSRSDMQEKDEAIERMLEKNGEMHALVSQLLLIARMEAGQLTGCERCDLTEILSAVAEDMEPVAEERNIAIHMEAESCETVCSRAMLTRAVVNLVDNAVRYGREGGNICLSLAQCGSEAVIAVEDDGPGLTAEQAKHVFERFWRADSARSAYGAGVGLSIVQAIAQAHGGEAEVRSAAGQGCCFVIRIPIRESEED